jgi:hypothetical protein
VFSSAIPFTSQTGHAISKYKKKTNITSKCDTFTKNKHLIPTHNQPPHTTPIKTLKHFNTPMHQCTTNTNIKFSMDLNSDKEYFQETKNKWIQELQTANRSVEEVAELLAKFYVSIKSIIVFYFTSSHSNFR